MSQPCKIAVFKTSRWVIKADAACKAAGIPVRVIAVPPTISSECGMCLKLTEEHQEGFVCMMDSLAIETKIYDYNFL